VVGAVDFGETHIENDQHALVICCHSAPHFSKKGHSRIVELGKCDSKSDSYDIDEECSIVNVKDLIMTSRFSNTYYLEEHS
jgi:hypothetical protein